MSLMTFLGEAKRGKVRNKNLFLQELFGVGAIRVKHYYQFVGNEKFYYQRPLALAEQTTTSKGLLLSYPRIIAWKGCE